MPMPMSPMDRIPIIAGLDDAIVDFEILAGLGFTVTT